MQKSKKKKVLVTPATIGRLAGLQGSTFPPDSILDHLFGDDDDKGDPQTVFVKGCVTMINYVASSTDIAAVLVREPGGQTRGLSNDSLQGLGDLRANNLSDYRELFETAANHGHGVFVETSANEIRQIVVVRCACPCKKRFVTDFFPEPGGVADDIDSLDHL